MRARFGAFESADPLSIAGGPPISPALPAHVPLSAGRCVRAAESGEKRTMALGTFETGTLQRRRTWQNRGRVSTAAILFVVMSMTFGCAHSIKTERARLVPLPPGAPMIKAEPNAVLDKNTRPLGQTNSTARDFAKSLRVQAGHQVSSSDSAPLVLSEVNVSSELTPGSGPSILLGVS